MLNPVLQDKMFPEHRVIYNLKMHLQDNALHERIVNSVQHIRKMHRRNGVNKLEVKANRYGNNGSYYFETVREAVKKLYKPKAISNEFIGQWRSIEFELIFKTPHAYEEFRYATRAVGVADFVTVQGDQSIKTNQALGIDGLGGVPQEITISYRSGDEENVRKFCKALKGRAYVNYSCGTHFHFDMRQHTEEQATEYGNRIAKAVPALRLLLPKDRRESKFQKQTINTTKTACVYPHKYAFVNLAAYNKHKTMEIRGHSGTINADKILNWIKLIECIMFQPASSNDVSTVDGLIETYKLDNQLATYVRERASRFEDVRSTWRTGPRHTTEEEEQPASQIDVPVHPAFLTPLPPPKKIKFENLDG